MTSPPGRVVVVGGGVSAHVLSTSLRSSGYAGELTIATREPHQPYDRPPLSKQALVGETVDAVTSATSFEEDYDSLGIKVRTDTQVTGLDESRIQTRHGDLEYDLAVLASGSEPIVLPGQRESPVAVGLRTREDAERLRAALGIASNVVIIGAGWIGAEVATAAAARGCNVTVVDAADSPLAAALPGPIGEKVTPWYQDAGVRLCLGSAVDRILVDGVRLVNGMRLSADLVVVGIGTRPASSFLASGSQRRWRSSDGAVLTDGNLAAVPGRLYAVGDLAKWRSPRFGLIRIEHWDHAVSSAQHVARAVLGDVAPYDHIPYIWSDQFGRRVQYVGHHHLTSALHIEPGETEDGWTAWWTDDGRLTAVMAVNQSRLIRRARTAIAGDLSFAPEPLARQRAVAELLRAWR